MPVESGSPFLFFETFFCLLSIILENNIIFVQTFNTNTMETNELIDYLRKKEEKLWGHMKMVELVFGVDSVAKARASARWATAEEILNEVIELTKKNNDENNQRNQSRMERS